MEDTCIVTEKYEYTNERAEVVVPMTIPINQVHLKMESSQELTKLWSSFLSQEIFFFIR